jgi:3-methyladenine DNA glycosylase AlkD
MAGIVTDLQALADPEKAKFYSRFFKTGKGEYGEGDLFLGIVVPKLRQVAVKFKNSSLDDLQTLLDSKYHEARQISLMILVNQYRKADGAKKAQIAKIYLDNSKKINNWDLVDMSAPQILGDYLLTGDRKILYEFARSDNLWKKRIAIMATFGFIGKNQFEETLKLSEILLHDKHDLIHKAVGWMLREVGNKDRAKEEVFLKKHLQVMPRTMLRYAIEKFPENLRQQYLKNEF